MRTADKPLHINVGRIVRSLMAARSYDQQFVSEAINVKQPALSKRLGGHTPWTLEDIAKLAELFDVSEAIFFADSEDLFNGVDATSLRKAPSMPVPSRRKAPKGARSRCSSPTARPTLPENEMRAAA